MSDDQDDIYFAGAVCSCCGKEDPEEEPNGWIEEELGMKCDVCAQDTTIIDFSSAHENKSVLQMVGEVVMPEASVAEVEDTLKCLPNAAAIEKNLELGLGGADDIIVKKTRKKKVK